METNVVFFNHFHNGDIHFSRRFVKYFADLFTKRGYGCYYYHRNNPALLADIPNVKHTTSCPLTSERILSQTIGNNIFLSTWYGANFNFIGQYGITFNCLYHIFEDHARKYLLPEDVAKFLSEDKTMFYPEVDYSAFNLQSINQWLLRESRKKVLVSNGNTLSGQASNVNMDPVLDTLAATFPQVLFIPTNTTHVVRNNVISSADIVGKVGLDLNETSYLSTFCDLIVGRCSGAYSFAMTHHNMFERNAIFVAFTNLGNNGDGALWYDKKDFPLNYSSRVVCGNYEDNQSLMISAISEEIRRVENG